MSDLDAIIRNAIDTATETGSVPSPMAGESEGGDNDEGTGEETADTDTGSSDGSEGSEETGEGAEGSDDSDSDTAEGGGSGAANGSKADNTGDNGTAKSGSAAVKSEEQKEFEAVLKELGINLPDEKAAKNRVPYGRSLRTLVNKVKKVKEQIAAEHSKVLSERDSKLQSFQQQLENFVAADKLAQTDPERYVALLAALYPDKYGRYAGMKPTVSDTKPAVDPNDPEPQPDKRDDQNVAYYSPERWQELRQWERRQAVREATEIARKENEKLYGPLVAREQAAAVKQQTLNVIRTRIGQAKKTYGEDLYKEHEDAIAKAINDDDAAAQRERRAPMTFEAIVASILVPKLQERVQKQREIVTEELKKAPAAASGGKPQGTRPRTPKDDDKPLEEKMADAVSEFKRTHGLR